MPNWCHDTVIVQGDDPADIARFVEAVKEPIDESYLREKYDSTFFVGDEKISFEEYVKTVEERRIPFSFQAIDPYVPEEWPDETETCRQCDGTGERPGGREEFGDEWYESNNGCNGCHGSGTARKIGGDGWYLHHSTRWGTKWDASFDEPHVALGVKGMDVEACVAAKGVTESPTMVVYKFDTAWSPPSAAIRTASEQHPNLELVLRFGEPGGGFAGEEKYVAGVLVGGQELDIDDVLMPEERWF